MFLLIEFCCGTPPSYLKVYGGGGGGLEQFSVSPRPLGFGFGTKGFGAKGLGPGLDNYLGKLSSLDHNQPQTLRHHFPQLTQEKGRSKRVC